MKTLEELIKETINLIVSMQKKGITNETIKKEISKVNNENVRMLLLSGIEALESKSYIFN